MWHSKVGVHVWCFCFYTVLLNVFFLPFVVVLDVFDTFACF